jgi:transposase-like protein
MPSYSDEQKGEALAALAANDGNVSKTRRQLSWDTVPSHKTIRRWEEQASDPETSADEGVRKSADRKKEGLADRLEEIAWNISERIDSEQKLADATISQLTTAFGTVVDKMRLLREEATEINESRDGDKHKRELAKRLERLRHRQDGPERQ